MKTLCKLAALIWLACAVVFGQAVLTTPAPGSTLTGSTVTFDWTCSSCGSDTFWLDIGTTAGGNNIYSSGNLGTVLTVTVQSLPLTGIPVYATLWTINGSNKTYNEYTYSTLNETSGAATLASISPCASSPCAIPGANLTSSFLTLTWNAGTDATAYWVDMGPSPGSHYNLQSGNLGNVLTLTTSPYFMQLPANGGPLYVTLYSLIGGQWFANSYQFGSSPSHYATLTWTASTGSDSAVSYNAYRSFPPWVSCPSGSGGTYYCNKVNTSPILASSCSSGTCTFTDTCTIATGGAQNLCPGAGNQGLVLGDNYAYAVTAVDANGIESAISNVAAATIP